MLFSLAHNRPANACVCHLDCHANLPRIAAHKLCPQSVNQYRANQARARKVMIAMSDSPDGITTIRWASVALITLDRRHSQGEFAVSGVEVSKDRGRDEAPKPGSQRCETAGVPQA